MKRTKTKPIPGSEKQKVSHSFLYWLIVPLVLVWLSIGYVTGIVRDKPFWQRSDVTSPESISAVPYFQEHGSFEENLDQPFITFWFDDAWLSQYQEAYPLLKKNNFTGTIAIPINAVETPNYMNWSQLQVMQKNGWEMTNHSVSHDCEMDKWDSEKVAYEFKTSKFVLWKNHLSSDIFASPCGVDSRVMREQAAKYFIAYRTVDPGYNDPKKVNFYNLKVLNIDDKVTLSKIQSWIDTAKSTKAWAILVFHKVAETNVAPGEEQYNISKENFARIVDYVKQSGITVVVPSQILLSQNL